MDYHQRCLSTSLEVKRKIRQVTNYSILLTLAFFFKAHMIYFREIKFTRPRKSMIFLLVFSQIVVILGYVFHVKKTLSMYCKKFYKKSYNKIKLPNSWFFCLPFWVSFYLCWCFEFNFSNVWMLVWKIEVYFFSKKLVSLSLCYHFEYFSFICSTN